MTRWILQCNPERYRLREALREGFDVRSWTVARYLGDIAEGDEFAMWISGPDGGICGLGVITSGAMESVEDPDPYWVDTAESAKLTRHVGIRLDHPLAEVIPRSVLKEDPDFADAAIIRMPGGGNPFPVTDAQWHAVASRIASPDQRRTRPNNPAWTRDELILALDVYLRQRGHIPSPRDADILELSGLLNRLPIHTVRPQGHGKVVKWDCELLFHSSG